MIDFRTRLACDVVPVAQPERVADAISYLGGVPRDYASFLNACSGLERHVNLLVRVEREIAGSGYLDLLSLYTVSDNVHRDVVTNNQVAVVSDMIAIGHDGGGARYMLSLAAADIGCIYYLDGEEFDDSTGPGSAATGESARTYLVAHSFEEFLMRLRLDDIGPEPVDAPERFGDGVAWASHDGLLPRTVALRP